MSKDSFHSADMIHAEPNHEPRDGPAESHLPQSASNNLDTPPMTKRRKRPPIGNDAASGSQMFYFVDSNSSSREKRAHVMRHHVQEKRRQRKDLHLRNDSEKRLGLSLHYHPWPQKPAELQDGTKDNTETTDVILSLAKNSKTLPSLNFSTKPEYAMTKPDRFKQLPPYLPSPATMLDASRKDPFDSLPTNPSFLDMELADYWTSRLTYWSGQNKYPKYQVFRSSISHPLAFRAIVLSYCARWKAQLYGQRNSSEVEFHLGCAKRSLEEAVKGHVEIDCDTLAMALSGMALQENRFGSKEEGWKYEDHAIQLLRSRPSSGDFAEVFLHFVRYITTPPPIAIGDDRQQWLVTFLRAAEELMLSHSTEAYLASVPQRRDAFQMESPLFPLLSSGPRPSQVPHDSRMYVVRNVPTQEVTRTVALIYITTTLWDLQDSPSKTARFLAYLHRIVKEHKLDQYPACESFVWLLLEQNCDPDLKDPERGWSTGELLKTHKQLRPELQFQYNETLLSFLMLIRPIRGVDAFEKELYPSQVEDTTD